MSYCLPPGFIITVANGENAVGKSKKKTKTPSSPSETEQFQATLDRANQGDAAALAEVRAMLQECPDPGIAVLGGDLAELAQRNLVDRIADGQPLFREAILAKLHVLRTELTGSAPDPLERLLVERVVTCWLHVAHADVLAAQAEKCNYRPLVRCPICVLRLDTCSCPSGGYARSLWQAETTGLGPGIVVCGSRGSP